MKKEAWQAWCLFALAACIFTNAAWYYRMKVCASEQPRPTSHKATQCEPAPQQAALREYPAVKALVAPEENQQCINGQLLERIPNGWRQVPGSC